MARRYDASVPVRRGVYGFALSFVPRNGLYGPSAARAVLAGLQEMAFSGRCEYYTWESPRGDNYVVSLALKNRTGQHAPGYDWWRTFARVVAGRTPSEAVTLDIHSSELASVDGMRQTCLTCGAVEFLDGTPSGNA